ncbi:MAG: peptidoglycan editing factor PgeF [Deltaproteobacteria bacterium]|nr:peptidoglycan editing factor PgeF [Deltaproteobacteria bacterium]
MIEPDHTGGAPLVRVASWSTIPGLTHGFCGRRGGVSQGPLASLNVSSRVGDRPEHVAENWRRVERTLPGLTFVRMQQVHGTRTVRVVAPDDQVGEADALITDRPGLGLSVLTADCVPLLGVAAAERAVMAVHAGWRGSLAGIAVEALQAARQAFGIEVSAWEIALGPSIAGCCYQVETEIGQQFLDRWGAMPDAWQPAGTHGQLDLRQANAVVLRQAGVPAGQIHFAGPCTACAGEEFYSHRGAAGRAGRQVSAIGFSVDAPDKAA